MRFTPTEEELLSTILILSREIWGNTIRLPDIERWLENFTGEVRSESQERLHALHLLSQFSYFGLKEIRELLRSIFRDLFRYPIIQELRTAAGGTRDSNVLRSAFETELAATRFLGMGNPSESGAHLLYYFRQVNKLNKGLFIHQHEVLDAPIGSPAASIVIPNLKRLVFIDDVLGSGTQAVEYSAKLLTAIKAAAARQSIGIEIYYFTLFAKETGLAVARATEFDRVDAVHTLDSSEAAFDADSRAYAKPVAGVDKSIGEEISAHYGRKLAPAHPLGYKDGQLMLGLNHNVPDNTLPIFWLERETDPWVPIFPRFQKLD